MSQFGMDLIDSQIHRQGLSGYGQKTVHVSLNSGNTDMIFLGNIKVGHTEISKILHDLIHGKVGVSEVGESKRIRFCKGPVTVVAHITGGCVNDDRLAGCQDRVIDFLGTGRTVNVS